jgi:hypothetical protein
VVVAVIAGVVFWAAGDDGDVIAVDDNTTTTAAPATTTTATEPETTTIADATTSTEVTPPVDTSPAVFPFVEDALRLDDPMGRPSRRSPSGTWASSTPSSASSDGVMPARVRSASARRRGALLFRVYSADDGSVWQAAALRVHF